MAALKPSAKPPAKPAAKPAPAKPAARAAKRGPGRPPSKPPVPPLEMKGVVEGPDDPNNILELVYARPTAFKDLFTFLRNIKAGVVHVRCEPALITFYARDHGKRFRSVARFAGEQLNWYYCESPHSFGLNRAKVNKIFASIDKNIHKITLKMTREANTTLLVILKDALMDRETVYDVKTDRLEPDAELYEAAGELDFEKAEGGEGGAPEVKLDFKLPTAIFKKSMQDISSYSDNITIEKVGNAPLRFRYTIDQHEYRDVYNDSKKISLKSFVEENEIFTHEVRVSNLKSLSDAVDSEWMRLVCRQGDRDLIVCSDIAESPLFVGVLVRQQI